MEDFESSGTGVFQQLERDVNFQGQEVLSNSTQNVGHHQRTKNSVECTHDGKEGQKKGKPTTDNYTEMMAKVDDMQKTLATVKNTLTQASVRCHMLNVDVVTMFNPETVETLNGTVEDCEACMKKMVMLAVPTDS